MPILRKVITMAKLIFSAITSLDGCTEDEDGNFDWGAPDEEVHSFVNDLERPVGTYLYGTPARPEQYILRVREDTSKRLDLVAFAAESARAIDELGARLGTAAVRIDREPGTLDTPGGDYGLRFFDPDGRLVEVSADVEARQFRELEPRESIPRMLSHVVFKSTDVLATKAFYETHLGFKLSDWLEDMMCFMRTRVDHYILAISKGPHTSLSVRGHPEGADQWGTGGPHH
jgi:catechol 2,3-dioxygenase-like lactoylglutathione lyase family enzyme